MRTKSTAHTLSFILLTVLAATLAAPALANNGSEPVPGGDAAWFSRHEAMNKRAKEGHVDLLYIGDSIVQHWEKQGKETWEKYYAPRNGLNLGISGDRTENVLWRLDNGNIDGISPKLAIVMIGQNNDGSNTAQEIADAVTAIVQRLRTKLPDTKVLMLAIFPRGEKPTPQRETLYKANEITSKLADGKHIFYMDINYLFVNPDGTMKKELMPDFEHPNPEGHRIWAEAIEPKVAELMGDTPIK